MNTQTERITKKLDELIRSDCEPFGTQGHKKERRPPLPEYHLLELEQEYGIKLPDEYRDFLLSVTSGAIGPAYGLLPFTSIVDYNRPEPPIDILSTPFPHIEHYDPNNDPHWMEIVRKCDDGEISDEEFDKLYTYVDAGTIAICHEGSGHVHRMVVTGPARGQMWVDSTGSDQGFIPLNVSYSDWYEKWLDDSLAGGNGAWWLANSQNAI